MVELVVFGIFVVFAFFVLVGGPSLAVVAACHVDTCFVCNLSVWSWQNFNAQSTDIFPDIPVNVRHTFCRK